ncbi:MAG: lysophospholipid acyltransferase family protein [Thiotrichales bacterium]
MAESPAQTLWLSLRASAFWIVFAASTIVFSILVVAARMLPEQIPFWLVTRWGRLNVAALKVICGLGYRVEGLEHIGNEPSIVLAKHQSTWETLALLFLLPPQVWVLKRELLRVPFFGWGLAAMQPIAIDRKAGRSAVEQVISQGRERLDRGKWVVIFPEGTRTLPGTRVRYKLGGARLAAATGRPVVPIAHNAGLFWPRHQFIKRPGTITVRIGPRVDSVGRSSESINTEVEAWIETQMVDLERRYR